MGVRHSACEGQARSRATTCWQRLGVASCLTLGLASSALGQSLEIGGSIGTAARRTFPNTDLARRILYVAMSRASYKLLIVASKTNPSPVPRQNLVRAAEACLKRPASG